MRLLNTLTGELKWFSDRLPVYAILSHVWGKDEQSFQGVSALPPKPPIDGVHEDTQGLPVSWARFSRLNPLLSEKIRGACMYARRLGFAWIWIDTCCIDKASSAELSEAINSMFKWYSKAELCIAYLEDVHDPPPGAVGLRFEGRRPPGSFQASKWFKRGWTLQELVAPRVVEFLSRGWKSLGMKAALAEGLERITGIDAAVLLSRRKLSDVCVADRMRWASKRITTRVEDRAYSLLGIFDISMPTLYGEGKKAFQRLQERIMTSSPDQTLFAWRTDPPLPGFWDHMDRHRRGRAIQWSSSLLATSPDQFDYDTFTRLYLGGMTPIPLQDIPIATKAFCEAIGPCESPNSETWHSPLPLATPSFTQSSHGVRARVPLIRINGLDDVAVAVLAVKCPQGYVALVLRRISPTSTLPHYAVHGAAIVASQSGRSESRSVGELSVEWMDVYIREDTETPRPSLPPRICPPEALSIPFWVIAKLAGFGFFLPTANPNGSEFMDITVTEPNSIDPSSSNGLTKKLMSSDSHQLIRTLGCFTTRGFEHQTQTLVFARRHPDCVSEILRLHFKFRPHSGPSADLGYLAITVSINDQRIPEDPTYELVCPYVRRHYDWDKVHDKGASTTRPVSGLWFGDEDRAVRLTYIPHPVDMAGPGYLDIELLGRVYEHCGRVHSGLTEDVPQNEDEPGAAVHIRTASGSDLATRARRPTNTGFEDYDSQGQRIDALMISFQKGIAAAKAQIAQLRLKMFDEAPSSPRGTKRRRAWDDDEDNIAPMCS